MDIWKYDEICREGVVLFLLLRNFDWFKSQRMSKEQVIPRSTQYGDFEDSPEGDMQNSRFALGF